ncbi:MAG: YdcF family protein [Bacteroidetes bacterium]|nr:YdcF family protein [Bacteroidota bacterium]
METDPFNSAIIAQPYDVAIVLGEVSDYFDDHTQRPLSEEKECRADSYREIALYKQGKVRKILLSGGSGMDSHPKKRNQWYSKSIVAIRCSGSRYPHRKMSHENTNGNAVNPAKRLNTSHPKRGKIFVGNLRFSMRRSLACFHKTGLQSAAFRLMKAGVRPLTPDNTNDSPMHNVW